MTDTSSFITLTGVHLTLKSRAGPVNILGGVDLSVAEGGSVALLGPSGSGKSSLLSIVAGLERPTAGTVEVAGTAFNELSDDDLALFRRRHLGIVFQSFHLIPTMTALENVAMPLELAGKNNARDKAAAELDTVGLGDRLEHYPGELSGGEQQRVATARAVVHDPVLLLADEPTGNLDGQTGGGIIDLLFSLHDTRGVTLLLVSHDPELAKRSERLIHMRDGRLSEESESRQPSPAVS